MADRAYRDSSVVVAAYRYLLLALSPTAESRTGHILAVLIGSFSVATSTSALSELTSRVVHWIRSSSLYRWLTAEPDPEVIVIDLRETYTVGPVLAVLDRLVTPLADAWLKAGTESLAETVHGALHDHPVRMVSFVALATLLTELALSAAFGTLASTDIVVRLGFVALAVLGTQIRVSWDQCTESATYRFLVAALEPPEPPESDESVEESHR